MARKQHGSGVVARVQQVYSLFENNLHVEVDKKWKQ